MAKLSGPIGFKGKLSDISAYEMKGCEGIVLRMGWGPSKEDIQTKDNYVNTRRINCEFGGRSTTGAYLKKVLQPVKDVFDFNLVPVLNGVLKPVQAEDKESSWGFRNVLLSRKPILLEGFNLNKRNPFDSVISSPFHFEVDKAAGTAFVRTPDLLPSVNFFPPENFSVCRITAVMGIVPDFYYASPEKPRYKPVIDIHPSHSATAYTDWFLASKGCPSFELNLSLPVSLPGDGCSLLIAVGVQVGRPSPGYVTPLKHNGCAKIAVVR
jgi:hypothetical protein